MVPRNARMTNSLGRGVFVAAAEPIVARGITAILADGNTGNSSGSLDRLDSASRRIEFATVGTASSVDDAERGLRLHRPPVSILVLDPPLHGATLDDACVRLIDSHPDTSALVLIEDAKLDVVQRVCRSAARGVFGTDIGPAELHTVLHQICSGQVVIRPSFVRHLVEGGEAEDGQDARGRLSSRELTVLQLLARGYVSKQIAPLLGTTAKAVDMMIERACRRLGASTRAQAVAITLTRRLIA
jgi:two-component system, NarL family, response regulator YdfI